MLAEIHIQIEEKDTLLIPMMKQKLQYELKFEDPQGTRESCYYEWFTMGQSSI